MNVSAKREALIFTEALGVPVEKRAAFLDGACGGDDRLRRKVEALLKSHEEMGDFLEESPDEAVSQARIAALADEKPLDRIGRYKLLQRIGEGGCGVVFMAEQEEPVRRRVALKVIKPGMDTESVIARFEAERQALALMDHPSIAKVFDAGATDSGRPYFVMELVRGVKITDYCDEHSLTTEERLKLFMQVCAAIQHAHQKGIIHRDIKPSNILVTTTSDGAALPVVIDFGIAKPTTNQRLTDKTLFTAFEMFIGTPAYISPEQAALTNADVDTRTDIYSLGVLLYELLTGLKPFDTTELLKEGIDEIRRVIREQEPVRPSTRLSKLNSADLTTAAQRRRSEPPKLIRAISGDMDWIVMKAMEKDRARRYETANGLALDVKRFLDHEAVAARPPSRVYKFRKLVRRNKLLFIGLGVIATLLIVSLIVVSAALAKERQTRREAEGDKRTANAEAIKSKQVTQFLEDMLGGVEPDFAFGRDTAILREILAQAATRVGKELTNQPAVQAELRSVIGTLYQRIGEFHRAEEMQRAALAIRRKHFGSESPEAATSLNDLGLALLARGKLSEAAEVHREALEIRRRLFGNENTDVAVSQNNLVHVLTQTDRLSEAEALAREALATRQKLLGNENLEVAGSLRNLVIILGERGKWAESEATAREVLSIRRRLLGPEHTSVAWALNDLAWAAGGNDKQQEAEALELEALEMRRKLLSPEHPDVAYSLYVVGDRMRQRGNLTNAYPLLSEALSIQRRVHGEDSPAPLYTLRSLALLYQAENKWSEAETMFREALAAWRKRAGNDHPQTLYALRNLAESLEGQGKWADAETVHREALAQWRQLRGDDDPQTLYSMHKLGAGLEAAGKLPEAEAVFRELLAAWRKRAGNEYPETLYAMRNLGRTLEAQGKRSEAVDLLREALAAWQKVRGKEDPQTLYTLGSLTAALEADGKLSEAEVVRREALASWRKRGENETPKALEELKGLVRVLILEKKFGEAENIVAATLTPTFIQQPSSVDILDLRLDLLVRQERWKEAVVDATLALKHQPTNQVRYHSLAPLLVVTGDVPAYKQLCQEMLRRFGSTTHSYIADRVAKSCLLSPRSDVDLPSIDKLADTALAAGEGDVCMPLFKMVKGLSMLRLGNFEKAIEWTEKSPNSRFVHAQAQGYAILAMAHWHLGHKDEARAMLAKGNTLAPPIASDDPALESKEKWKQFHETAYHARLLARIQLEEASSLIGADAPPKNDPPSPERKID
jgi:serine/threonine protein kinase/Tfp pilus assembly protein PilF